MEVTTDFGVELVPAGLVPPGVQLATVGDHRLDASVEFRRGGRRKPREPWRRKFQAFQWKGARGTQEAGEVLHRNLGIR